MAVISTAGKDGCFVEVSLSAISGTTAAAGHVVVVLTEGPRWNYTSVLNLLFLALAAGLVWRFLRTGGPSMLRMMGGAGQPMAAHEHHGH